MVDGMKSPISLSLFTEEVLQPYDHLHDPPLDLLQLRTPEMDAVLQGGLIQAEYRSKIYYLDLLTTVLWMQPRTHLTFWAENEERVQKGLRSHWSSDSWQNGNSLSMGKCQHE
ncbi:hypothetical protein BTVI_45489 [Pitangus sulphuratus]|nr:hypothetical protein BTVI_45489 [Pitangus sulphuratus]